MIIIFQLQDKIAGMVFSIIIAIAIFYISSWYFVLITLYCYDNSDHCLMN